MLCLIPFVYAIGFISLNVDNWTFRLFVVVVSVGCEDEHDDFCVMDFIYKAVLLGDAAAPLACPFTCQRFGMACAYTGMLTQFRYQRLCLQERFWLILGQ